MSAGEMSPNPELWPEGWGLDKLWGNSSRSLYQELNLTISLSSHMVSRVIWIQNRSWCGKEMMWFEFSWGSLLLPGYYCFKQKHLCWIDLKFLAESWDFTSGSRKMAAPIFPSTLQFKNLIILSHLPSSVWPCASRKLPQVERKVI